MREATIIEHKIQLNFLILIVLDFLNRMRLLGCPLANHATDDDPDEY